MLTTYRSADVHAAVRAANKARHAASAAEKSLLLLAGWEEQATHHGVTWWYREGSGCSEPQESAIRLTLMDYERANRA